MRLALIISMMAGLASCGTFTRVDPSGATTIQAGVLSSIQAVVIQVKPGRTGMAPTVTISQTGFDGTSVANNLAGTIVPVAAIHGTTAVTRSNNVTGLKKAGVSSKEKLGLAKIDADKTTKLAKIAKAPSPTVP